MKNISLDLTQKQMSVSQKNLEFENSLTNSILLKIFFQTFNFKPTQFEHFLINHGVDLINVLQNTIK